MLLWQVSLSPPSRYTAEESVDGQTISSIGKGLLVLIGIDKRMSPSVNVLQVCPVSRITS